MGGQDRTQTVTIVRNELELEIKQINNNMTKITNETTTQLSSELVNETAASIEISNSAVQTQDVGDIVIRGKKNKVDIKQQARIEAQNKAIITIISKADSLMQLGNKIADEVINKVNQNAQVQQAAKTMNAIADKSKDAGGIEGMVSTVVGMVEKMTKNLTGGSSSDSNYTNIKNQIKTQLTQETNNTTNVDNIIRTSVQNKIKNVTSGSCKMNTATTQIQSIKSLAILGEENDFDQTQEVSLKAFNDCLLNLQIGSEIVNNLTNGNASKITSDTKNVAETEQKQDAKTDVSKEKIKNSAIAETIDNAVNKTTGVVDNVIKAVIYIGGGIVLVIIIIVGALLISGTPISSILGGTESAENLPEELPPTEESPPAEESLPVEGEEQSGGNLTDVFGPGNGKMYLLAGIAALLVLLYNKSIPLCGIVLIVLVMFILYKQKTT